MLAAEFVQFGDLGFGFAEALRVQIQRVAIARQRVVRLTDLDFRGIEQFAYADKIRVDLGQARRFAARARGQAHEVEFAVAFEQFGQRRSALDQLAGVAQAAMGFIQRVELCRLEREAVEFGHLVFEQGNTFGVVLLSALHQRAPARVERAPLSCQRSDQLQRLAVATIRVEQGELTGAVEQRLMLVLAVDLQQVSSQRLHLAQGRRMTIDPCPRRAFAANHAAQLAGISVIELLAGQPCMRGGGIGQREFRNQFGTLAAMPHDAGIGALASEQQERVDKQ